MTISSQVRTAGPFDCNGSTTVYPFTFKVFNASDVSVVYRDTASGDEVSLVLNIDYTVSLNADQNANPGGSISTIGPAFPTGATLTLTSKLQYLQPTDLTNQGGFYPKVITDALDRLTIFAQQILGLANRALKFPISDGNLNATIPGKDQRKGRVMAFDPATGLPIAGPLTESLSVGVNYIGDTQPDSPFQGMRWYNPTIPATFVYYVDGDSGQWVEEASQAVDGGLRDDLADSDSTVLVGGVEAGKVGKSAVASPSIYEFYSGDWSAAFTNAFNSERAFHVPKGDYAVGPILITGKAISATFAEGARLVFTHQGSSSLEFVGCTGYINGMSISDTKETIAGIYGTLVFRQCNDFTCSSAKIYGGKDLAAVIIDSSNVWIKHSYGIGSDDNRPFAWQVIGSDNSGFDTCRLFKYLFGFMIIGSGYDSGTVPDWLTTRPALETTGMKAVNCYVLDHTGHAFDVNGAVGAGFYNCVAKDYTGVSGNIAFQVKQSTNSGTELPDETYANVMSNCIAINEVGGFGAQEGTDLTVDNCVAINTKRYPFFFNSTKRVKVTNCTAYDWATDLVNWPLLSGDTSAGAISFQSGCEGSIIDNFNAVYTSTTNPNYSIMQVVTDKTSSLTIGKLYLNRQTGGAEKISRAIEVIGAGCKITGGFGVDSGLLNNNAIADSTNTCEYPVSFTKIVDMSVSGLQYFEMPQRGFSCGKVFAYSVSTTGSPQYSVGRVGSNAAFVASRVAPATGANEYVNPLTAFASVNVPLVANITPSGGSGSLIINIRGVNTQ